MAKEQDSAVINQSGIIPFPDEVIHLEEINKRLDEALTEAQTNVGRLDREYTELKRYMVERRGETDPHEMFQNELGLKQIDSSGAFAVNVRDRLEKLKDSPYFARIDFNAEVFYIGRFAFTQRGEMLVSDWRSPVAGMFYDCELGPAGYSAPMGRITGELTRKRQFKITNGKMEYAFESSSNIRDEVLQRELSHTSDEKMKSIIGTIQREQNQIIRNENAGTMIIQGAAGSGKTSIALHRVAFLLYRFKERLNARNIVILSPNKVFGDYISGVLPELGEEPIFETGFAEIAAVQLEGVIGFEPDKDPLEDNASDWMERARFKSTLAFLESLEDFASKIPGLSFKPVDYKYQSYTAPADFILSRFDAYAKYPVKRRLSMVADDIYNRLQGQNYMEDDIPKSRTILKSLKQMLTVKDTLTLYKDFYERADIARMFKMPAKKTLEWADVYPFLYIHAVFEGLTESGVIKHLVIDEMQDYTPVQYAVLNLLFKCQKTVLGDFGQSVNPNHLHTLEDLKAVFNDAEYCELVKSYRSTYEIIQFARQFKNVSAIEPVERRGEPPEVIKCADAADGLVKIKEKITAFNESGYSSLGIIAKTNKDAERLYGLLKDYCEVNLISPDGTRFVNGVSVMSVQMSKGLEFDEVIIPGAGEANTDNDRNLLYIACTRALHRLTLLK